MTARETKWRFCNLRDKVLLAFAACALSAACAANVTEDEYAFDDYAVAFDRFHTGASAEMALPQGGAHARRVAGGSLRAGHWLTEFWAAEAAAAFCEKEFCVSGGVLWLWWGYERLDPFFTFGLRDWVETDCGPYAGTGTYWHIDDHWSLRLDASAMLGVEGRARMMYGLGIGVERSF